MCGLWSDQEVEAILKEIAEDGNDGGEDGNCLLWRAMSIVLELRAFIEQIVSQIRSTDEPVSLFAVSEYMQLALEEGRSGQFGIWTFDIYQGPAILKEFHRQPSAGLLNKRLAEGLYNTVVVSLAFRIFANEARAAHG